MTKQITSFVFQNLSSITAGALIATLVITAVLIHKNKKVSQLKNSLLVVVVIQTGQVATYAVLLWLAFRHTTYAKAFLPPHGTFLLERSAQLLTSHLVGWIAAGVFLIGSWYVFIRRGQATMLDQFDILLLTVSAAAVGWPNILIFLATTFVLALGWMITLVAAGRRSSRDRLIITPAIIPAAIITLISGPWLAALTHLNKIKF